MLTSGLQRAAWLRITLTKPVRTQPNEYRLIKEKCAFLAIDLQLRSDLKDILDGTV